MAEKPFWQGYSRSPEVTERLISAIRAALYASPSERLGQILLNCLPSDGYGQTDLFGVFDEDVIDALEIWLYGGD